MTDQDCDPFGERAAVRVTGPFQLLGASYRFESNSRELLRIVGHAYAGLPAHRFSRSSPQMRVRLLVTAGSGTRRRSEPPPLQMLSGAGLLGGATESSNAVVISPRERSALVMVSPRMMESDYHTRYELIEFAVFTLAVRVQQLASLHGACVGMGDCGVLLMGDSGAGKSTVALQCLLEGFDFLSEDSVFVAPESMRATGVANFLHVRSDSLSWVESRRDIACIRKSPTIRRRSGVSKYEVDLRRARYRLAASPLRVVAIVFLSARPAGRHPLLSPLSRIDLLDRLTAAQGYAANRPGWSTFKLGLAAVRGFELRRGSHPRMATAALRQILE
jgi:HPr Serine kinase C-terminal domain